MSDVQEKKPVSKTRKIMILVTVAGIAVIWFSSFYLNAVQADKQLAREKKEYAEIKEFLYNRIVIHFPDDTVHKISGDDWSCKYLLIRDGGDLPSLKPMFDEFCDERHGKMIKEAYFEIFRENSKEELAWNKNL